MNLTEGNLYNKLWIFTLPLIFSGILQLLYNACDLIVCGQFGSEHAVAAISATNSLVNLIVNLFLGLSIGANVLMARYYGANDKERGQRVVYTAMIFSLIIGIVIGIFGASLSHIFLKWMKTPSDVIDLSSKYLFIYFLGLPFSMVYNFGASILRATGDTKKPFIFLTTAGIINVLLNLFFVIVCNLDVMGVALATIISQGVSAILIVISMMKNNGFYHFKLRELKIDKTETINMIRIGLPAGLQSLIFSISNVLIQSSINSLGTDVLDGNGASSSLEGFIYTAMNQVAHGCVAFVSANYGAKNIKNIKKSILYSLSIVMIVWLIVASAIYLSSDALIMLYLKKGSAGLIYAKKRLKVIALSYFLCGIMDTLAYSMRGLGYSLVPTIVSLVGACGFRLLWIFLVFPKPYFHNIEWLAASYPISWILTLIVHLAMLIVLYNVVKKKFNTEDKKIELAS